MQIRVRDYEQTVGFSYQPLPFLGYDKTQSQFFKSQAKYKLDLNLYCINKPTETYLIEVNKNDLLAWGVTQGDLLVVEKTQRIQLGDWILLEEEQGFTLYEFFAIQDGMNVFISLDSKISSLKIPIDEEIPTFGVITKIVHNVRRRV